MNYKELLSEIIRSGVVPPVQKPEIPRYFYNPFTEHFTIALEILQEVSKDLNHNLSETTTLPGYWGALNLQGINTHTNFLYLDEYHNIFYLFNPLIVDKLSPEPLPDETQEKAFLIHEITQHVCQYYLPHIKILSTFIIHLPKDIPTTTTPVNEIFKTKDPIKIIICSNIELTLKLRFIIDSLYSIITNTNIQNNIALIQKLNRAILQTNLSSPRIN